MAKQYSPLLGLSLQHSYYRDGLCRDFRLSPSPVTASIFHKLDIRPKVNASGVELYWGYEMRDDLPKSPLKEQTEDLVLTFLLEPTKPTFFNYTDFPFPQSAQHKYYYQGRYSGANNATPTPLDGQEVEMFPMQSIASFTPPTDAMDLELELVNLAGQSLGVDTITAEHSGKGKYPIALSADDDWGEYAINVTEPGTSSAKESGVVHILPGSMLVRCFGLVQLVIPAGEIAALSATSTPGEAIVFPQFEIAFTKRSTNWRYYFINQSNLDFDELQLQENDEEIKGIKIGDKDLPNGSKATAVTLPDALPLEEATIKKINLVLLQHSPDGGDSKTLFTIQLPTPNTDRIYPERSGDDFVIYSDLYVYL